MLTPSQLLNTQGILPTRDLIFQTLQQSPRKRRLSAYGHTPMSSTLKSERLKFILFSLGLYTEQLFSLASEHLIQAPWKVRELHMFGF